MLARNNQHSLKNTRQQAYVFAALGDTTRLSLVAKLNDGGTHSISELAAGCRMSRQAVTKHLGVLEGVGLVSKIREGRESLYSLDPKPLKSVREYLDIISSQWDHALQNLINFVEDKS